MKTIFSVLILFISSVSFAQQNTILLIADDVSPDYFGFYANSDTAVTPILSDLASKGVVFDHAWAYPVCSPTRASMFTGRYGFRTGIGAVVAGANTNQLSTSETSLATVLKAQAPTLFSTACVGKWHLHAQQGNLNNPSIMGYDLYSGNFAGAIPDYYNYTKITNGASSAVTNYSTTEIIDDAIDWLDTIPSNQPFFLWVAFNAPHDPFHKPPSNLISRPNLPGTTNHINQNRDEYFKASIDALDTETGRLLQYLSTNGLLDSTNIIFIGDNGSPNQVTKSPVTGRSKGTIYNYGVEIPMFISGPAVVAPNRRTNEMVSTVDMFATIADLSGVTNWNPNSVIQDTRTLMPVLKNQSSTIRGYQYSELFGQSANNDGKSIRNLDYHLIRFDSTGTQEFYKISTDTFEANDLLLSVSTMTATDISNYHLLCDSLNNLVGGIGCMPLATNDIEKEYASLRLYPNPVGDIIYFKSEKEIDRISIYDAQGRLINTRVENNITEIETKKLAQGYYYIKINNRAVRPFIKD